MAALVFRNFILNRQKLERFEGFWTKIDPNIKYQMKLVILNTLASPQAVVRQQVANLISGIASIEIPLGEWDDLIPNLCHNSQHTDFNIRLISLTSLGYICEEIKPKDISDPVKNNIILALINNLSSGQNEESV